jgi:hypothetical protein
MLRPIRPLFKNVPDSVFTDNFKVNNFEAHNKVAFLRIYGPLV